MHNFIISAIVYERKYYVDLYGENFRQKSTVLTEKDCTCIYKTLFAPMYLDL